MTVPQVGHLPLIAFRPFFMVSSTALAISFLALHLTQYPSAISGFCRKRFMRPAVVALAYVSLARSVNWERAGGLEELEVPENQANLMNPAARYHL